MLAHIQNGLRHERKKLSKTSTKHNIIYVYICPVNVGASQGVAHSSQ